MPGTCHRTRVWIFLSLLAGVGCGDDGARQLSDAADSVEADAGPEEDAAEPEDGEDAGEGSEGDGSQAEEDTDGGVSAPGKDGGSSAAGDASASAADAAEPVHNLGTSCHDIDFDGPQNLIRREMVSEHWPEPSGGDIVPGTYDLVSEQRFVAADATSAQAAECADYWGAYWERIVLTESEWSLLNRNEDHTVGRQIFAYETHAGQVERTLTCPEPDSSLPAQAPRPYSASADELLLFDDLHEDGQPPYCEYLFTYVRKP